MKTSRHASRFAGALLIAGVAGVSPAPSAAPSEPEALERELVAAIAKGDLATYDRIVADDYVAFQASGEQSTKAQIMASYRSGARHYTGLEIFDVEAHVYGDAAVVSAKTKGYRREGDRDVPNRVRYIRVYARRDGRWRAVTQMAASLPDSKDGAPPRQLRAGSWGGNRAGMDVTENGARLDFDCAHGTIDAPVRLDEGGRFEVAGTYSPEGPGPIRQGEARGETARYAGRVEGDTMTLTITPAGSDKEIGTFTLVRGRLPQIHKCG